jgi:microcystin-dependent protein
VITLRFREQLPPLVADELDGLVASLQAIQARQDLFTEPRTVPAGIVAPFAGAVAPEGWLLANGQAVDRGGYSALFAAIGTAYGAGDGATTFNVPDLRQRFPLGKAAAGTGSTLAGTGGTIDHTHGSGSHTHDKGTLAVSAGGSHAHTVNGHTHGAGTYAVGAHGHSVTASYDNLGGGGAEVVVTSVTSPTGSAAPDTDTEAAHSHGLTGSTAASAGTTDANNPPYVVLNYLIKA